MQWREIATTEIDKEESTWRKDHAGLLGTIAEQTALRGTVKIMSLGLAHAVYIHSMQGWNAATPAF